MLTNSETPHHHHHQGSKGINIKIWLGIKILFRSEIKINTYKNPDDLRLRREKKWIPKTGGRNMRNEN